MKRAFGNVTFPDELALKYSSAEAATRGVSDWILLADFRVLWTDQGRQHGYTARAGLITDRSSIPGWAQSLIHKDGPKIKASVIHDDMYARRREHCWPRRDVDRLFYHGLRAAGVGWLEANAMYYAVRIGGHSAWMT